MKRLREEEIRIIKEAIRWQRDLHAETPEVRAQFFNWIKASPQHLREFLFMEALDAASQGIDAEQKIDVDLRVFATTSENVIPMGRDAESQRPDAADEPQVRPNRRRRPAYWPWLTTAAAVMATALGLTWWFAPGLLDGWDRYVTSVGEQRSVELSDGSLLQLNSHSSVEVLIDSKTRDVKLIDGEAFFKVAHDSVEPFRVFVGNTMIRDIGTQFDVYRRANRTEVSVLEGKVSIQATPPGVPEAHASTFPSRPAANVQLPTVLNSPTYVAAGHAAYIENSGEVLREAAIDVLEVTAWRERRLVFRDSTLTEIAEQFNLNNRRPKLVIKGPNAGERRYGGTFDSDDPQAFVEFLKRDKGLELQVSDSQVVVYAR